MSSYSPQSLHQLLRQLLAPVHLDRLVADKLLGNMLMCVERGGPMQRILSESLKLFGDARSNFLKSLIHWWLIESAKSQTFMLGATDTSGVEWRMRNPLFQNEANADSSESFSFWFGLGVSRLVELLDDDLSELNAEFLAGLSHPNSSVRNASLETLARNGQEISAVLEFLYLRGGNYGYPCAPKLLVEFCQRLPQAVEQLLIDFQLPVQDQRVEFACYVFDALPPKSTWLEAALRKLDSTLKGADFYLLFASACSLSARLGGLHSSHFCDQAQRLISTQDADQRGAAAHAFAHFGPQEPLISLLSDPDWEVRDYAAIAAACVSAPSTELVCAVAALLGDFAGHGGLPHYRAVSTLTRFGPLALVAQSYIVNFIENEAIEEHIDKELLQIIEGIGAGARVLQPSVLRYLQRWQEESPDEIQDEDDVNSPEECGSEDESSKLGLIQEPMIEWDMQSDINNVVAANAQMELLSAKLMRALAIDPNENIPGTLPFSEYPPDANERLHEWSKSGLDLI